MFASIGNVNSIQREFWDRKIFQRTLFAWELDSLHRPPGPSEPSVILGFFRKSKNYQKFSVVILARILMILKKKRKLVYLSIDKDKRPQENVVK